MKKSIEDFFSEPCPDTVISDPLVFKKKLNIGADAFKILCKAESIETGITTVAAGAGGAAIAGATWWAGLSTWGTIGATLGMTTTPVGWISAAGLGTAAATYGVRRFLKKAKGASVDEIPRFINSGIDALGANIFSLIAPILVYIGRSDGSFCEKERAFVVEYFENEWGFSTSYIEFSLSELEGSPIELDISLLTAMIDEVVDSGDIKRTELVKEIHEVLSKIMDVDGEVSVHEEKVFNEIKTAFSSNFDTKASAKWESLINSSASSSVKEWFNNLLKKHSDDEAKFLEEERVQRLPTIWLLGKTGAGKSTLIREITEYIDVPIGNGFEACTKTIDEYLVPADKPLLKILDTRGLGEPDYDANADIEFAGKESDLIIVLARLNDPEQSEVLRVLKKVGKYGLSQNVIVIHNQFSGMSQHDQERLLIYQREQFNQALKRISEHIVLDLKDGNHKGHQALRESLAKVIPTIAFLVQEKIYEDGRKNQIESLQALIIRYAGTAAAAGSLPGIGSISVVTTQGLLIREISESFSFSFDRDELIKFFSAMGLGFAIQHGLQITARSLLAHIPLAGNVAAGAFAFGSTYAIGQVAAHYYYNQANNSGQLTEEDLQKIYSEAFSFGQAQVK